MGAPRYTDPRSPHTGIQSAGSAYPDIGAFEFVETADSDIDLIVTSVSGPLTAKSGDMLNVSWSVTNIGDGYVVGPWHDAIYLVLDPDGSPTEILAGEALVGQNVLLGPGQSHTASATVRVPGSVVGNHRWGVKTNIRGEVYEGKNINNNKMYSLAPVALDLPELLPGASPLVNRFTDVGERHWFKITPGAGKDVGLNLSLSGTTGGTRILVGQGYLPDPQHFDFRENEWNSANTSALITDTSTRTYYVTIYPQSLSGSNVNYTLSARSLDFTLNAVNPGAVSNAGMTTFELSGGQLKGNAVYQIVGPDGVAHNSASIFVEDSTRVYATFNLNGLTPGGYSAQVVEDGKTISAANAFNVVTGSAGQIAYSIEAPSAIRPGWSGQVTINYRNVGNSDAVAPLLRLEATGATFKQIAPQCTGCSPTLQQTYGTIFDSGLLLGINRNGPAGILPPGQSGSITIDMTSTINSGNISFVLHTFNDPNLAFDTAGLKEALRPYYISADAWDAIYANFMAVAGTTVGQFNALLADDATYLSRQGIYEQDIYKLFSFEMYKASQREITRRYTLGSFGRGSSHELDQWGEFRSGNPVIHYPGGTVREFYADPAKANQYLGGVGDYARIALNPADQSLTLSEQNGLEDYFIPDPANPGRYIYEQRKDLNGNVMKLAYIGGRLVSVSDIATGDILSFSYNNQGRINQMTDPVGRTTSYVYDEAGEHLLSLTDSRGTTGYSYVSGQGAALEHALSAITYQDGTHLNFEYDERGRLIRRYRDNNSELMTFSYDANGVTTVSDAAGNRSEILPDLNGRPGQFVDPLGQITRLFYNVENRLVSGISPSGAAISREYDSQGNSSALHDPLGNRTTMTYTSYGRLLSIANSAGSGESFEYDGKYNNTKIIYPDGSYGKYSYDAAGNLVSRTDRRGRKIEFVYDDKRLLTRKNYADGSHVDLAYDSHRNLLSVTGSGSATSFSYDLADRLTGINYPGGRSLRYAYDVGGRRSQVKDGSGFIVNYSYDPAGRLWRVTDGSGSPIVTYGYDASGRLARKEMGNGTYVTHVYDQVGRMLQLTNYRGDGSVISRFEYSYDADGRKIGVSTLDGVWSYAYDNAGQLTTVVKPDRSTISYRYDAAGNRVTLTDNSVVTNYSTHGGDAYSDVGTARYSYDLNGNVVSKVDGVNIWTYSYNDENRLTSMTTPSGNWSYEYDSLGNRVAQTHNGQRSEYLVDPTGMSYVIASFDGSGNLVNHYAYGLDLSAAVDNAGVAAFYHFDDSANTVQVSGAAGAVLNSYSYLPFGEKSVSSETVANPFTFAGRYGVADDGNGLYFMRNRWYDPAVGRFTQPDPVGIAGGDVNLYRYVSNNPVSKIDPVGLQGEQVDYPTIVNIITAPLSQIQGHLSLINDWDELGGKIVGRSGTALNVVGAAVNTATYARTYDEFTHGRSSQAELIHDATVWGTSVVFPFFGKAGSVGSLVVNYVDYGSQFIFLAGSTIAYSEGAKWGPAAIAHFNGLKWDPGAQARTGIIASRDPNDKITVGYGSEGFIAEGAPISYTIDFENVASASAAAQQVVISDTLDANLDWSTLELSQISFNNVTVSVPTGLQSFSGETNVTTDPYPVKVAVTFNPATGQLVWTLQSIDPVTGTLPRDPYAGFLPPNDATRRGQGAVRFTIKPKSGLANGTTISNQASIVFDSNAAITTNKAINTIDTTNPASTVASLSANNITSFTVSWGGSDPGSSGVAYYDVYVSTDGGSFSPWLSGTAQTSGTFTGSVGHSYGFYSIALDNVGNRSAVPSASQAATTVTNLYSVTPSAGIGGSISPATPQSVYQNDNASFTVSAAADYRIDTVTGCGGTLTGSTFTTAAVTADCTVSASFVLKRDGVIDPGSGKTAPDIGDALKVFRYVNGLATLTDAEKAHADVAPLGTDWKPLGDGIVDIGDVVIIMRRIVGAVNW
jgi:RHS repeat-associated protein